MAPVHHNKWKECCEGVETCFVATHKFMVTRAEINFYVVRANPYGWAGAKRDN
jgi:hypothetical protein